MTELALTIAVYDGTVEPATLNETAALYREVYAEPPYLEGEDDFANFAEDLPKRAKQESFRLVIARRGDRPLGFAMGHRLPVSTRWWEGAFDTLPDDVTTEYEGRTFAIIELAVREPYRRQEVGERLHTHLTAGLSEERVTLLVRPDAAAAQAAYLSWSYRKVGRVRPFPEAPVYDAMLATARKFER